MAKILGTVNRVGNFYVREEWRDLNHCRMNAVIDFTGVPELCETIQGEAIAQVGVVVYEDADALGTYVVMDASYVPVTDKIGILVDERVGDPIIYTVADGQKVLDVSAGTTDSATLAILYKGEAYVRLGGLIYPVAQEANVIAGLEDAGITLVTQLEGIDSASLVKPFTAITSV